jgi:hypothetical protein
MSRLRDSNSGHSLGYYSPLAEKYCPAYLSLSPQSESNRRPLLYESIALPAELCGLSHERDTRIELASQPWEGRVLPLN